MESKPNQVGTHAVTTPNKRLPTPVEAFKLKLFNDHQKQVENFFRGDKEKAMKFMSAVTYSVQKTPGLLECEPQSLMNAFMSCAEYELYPSSVSGEAYVLPYKGKAQFQLGYKGIITLAYRAGVSSIRTNIVYQNDHFEYEEGLDQRLVHKPVTFGQAKGEPIGVYAIATVNGENVFKVMTKDEVMGLKEFSQAKDSQYSPWNAKNDPELWMWRKTCIKQLSKVLPSNDALQRALAEDNKESVIAARQQFDAAGPAVGRALHAPIDESAHSTDAEPTINIDDK